MGKLKSKFGKNIEHKEKQESNNKKKILLNSLSMLLHKILLGYNAVQYIFRGLHRQKNI